MSKIEDVSVIVTEIMLMKFCRDRRKSIKRAGVNVIHTFIPTLVSSEQEELVAIQKYTAEHHGSKYQMNFSTDASTGMCLGTLRHLYRNGKIYDVKHRCGFRVEAMILSNPYYVNQKPEQVSRRKK